MGAWDTVNSLAEDGSQQMPDEQLQLEITANLYAEGGLATAMTGAINDEITVFAAGLEKELRALRRSGMSDDAIRRLLLDDVAEGGGRFFKPFRNSIVAQFNMGVAEAAEIGKNSYLESKGVDTSKWKWRVTQSKSGPCPDCGPRAGRVETMEIWETIGTPRSGFSVCREGCLCSLDPVGVDTPDKVVLEE